ncbi:MAG: FAD-binding and (Fe-S)-binding domain-containing protein [Candidatus Methanofastidiosia archaeon]
MSIGSELKSLFGSEKVLHDEASLYAYSMDGSIYRVQPKAVVFVESEEDVLKALEFSRKKNLEITCRAAGTSLAGQALGEGIILYFCRFNQILEFDEKERYVRVQPGIIYRDLNNFLSKYNLMFAPDPASGDTCRIGGMLANNSSGPRTIKYGTTKEYVEELKVMLHDSRVIVLKRFDLKSKELQDFFKENPEFEKIFNLVRENSEEIKKRYPKVRKNSSGYNLYDLALGIERGFFDLPKLFVGSEGTLGVFLQAKLRLEEVPSKKATVLVYLDDVDEAGDVVFSLFRLNPSAVEILNSSSLDIVGREKYEIPEDAEAMLLIELSDGDLKARIEESKKILENFHLSSEVKASFGEQGEELWKVRRAIVPTLYKMDKKKKPLTFVEDGVVPTEKLPKYVRFVNELFEREKLKMGMYGHIGDGNAHVRPLINVHDEREFLRMKEIADKVYKKLLELGGSFSGEHGDGRVRAQFLRILYGERIYEIFKEIKEILDPDGIFNPKAKISSVSFLDDLFKYKFLFNCSTCGKCNSWCPSYYITNEESMGARGWIQMVRDRNFSYKTHKKAIANCLNCKSCEVVCPAEESTAREIMRIRANHPNFVAGLIFELMRRPLIFENFLKLNAFLEPLWNNKIARSILDVLTIPAIRLKKERILPSFSKKNLRERYPELQNTNAKVAYFYGCADNYLETETGDAVIHVLRENEINFVLPPQKCCGIPMVTYGNLKYAIEYAKFNIDSMLRYEHIISACGTCVLALKEYEELLKEDSYQERAREFSKKVQDISQFLLNIDLKIPDMNKGKVRITYHDPCHSRAANVTKEPRELLKKIPFVDYVEMTEADKCCGSAGSYMLTHYDNSMKIFELKRKTIEETKADVVATSCPTCKIQILDGLKGEKEVRHVVEILRDVYT